MGVFIVFIALRLQILSRFPLVGVQINILRDLQIQAVDTAFLICSFNTVVLNGLLNLPEDKLLQFSVIQFIAVDLRLDITEFLLFIKNYLFCC